MDLSWNPAAIPGLIITPLIIAMAALVFFVRPDRRQNQFLAGFLVLTGLGVAFGHTLRFLVDDVVTARAAYHTYILSLLAAEGFQILFLATLGSKGLSWLRTGLGRSVVLAAMALGILAGTAWPQLVASGMERINLLGGVYVGREQGYLWWVAVLAGLALGLLGIITSLGVARRAKAGLERAKAQALARAYIGYEAIAGPFLVWSMTVPSRAAQGYGPLEAIVNFYAVMTAGFLLSVLLAYGILKSQLFDVDVKIKWTVKRGTLAGIFVATFFVVSQFLENVLDAKYGTVGGAVAVGLLLFAITPLQKFAERLSSVAVPGAAVAVLEARKIEIYKAALEGAWQDGKLTDKERTVLTRLQLELGIANAQARNLERELRGLPA